MLRALPLRPHAFLTMRILGIGDWNDLGDMYLRLARGGHEVRVHIGDPSAHDILEGLVHRIEDWRTELAWVRAAGDDGVIVFETAHHGALQDQLRREGYRVIGGCAYGDRLESDRAFGQLAMAEAGMQVLPSRSFADPAAAAAFIAAEPARYVLKFDATGDVVCSTYVGAVPDGSDVVALLRHQAARQRCGRILLMRHVLGVEVGVGAYFNGQRFLGPACLDWEHKRFFPGDVGELTGEMGTLVTYRGSEALFERTLARFAPRLREAGYVGYINLNTIVDREGIWPLEFTCRFGYPGYAILDPLQPDGWADLLRRMLDPDARDFAVAKDYAIGVVLTVPPFPYPHGYERLGKGSPVAFIDLRPGDMDHMHLAEVAQREDGLVCSGQIGYPLVVTGTGIDAAAAREAAYARVGRVVIPDMRYRHDIGSAFIARDHDLLREWGYLPDER